MLPSIESDVTLSRFPIIQGSQGATITLTDTFRVTTQGTICLAHKVLPPSILIPLVSRGTNPCLWSRFRTGSCKKVPRTLLTMHNMRITTQGISHLTRTILHSHLPLCMPFLLNSLSFTAQYLPTEHLIGGHYAIIRRTLSICNNKLLIHVCTNSLIPDHSDDMLYLCSASLLQPYALHLMKWGMQPI